MANTKSTKKTATKAVKKITKPRVHRKKTKKTVSADAKEFIAHISDSAREQLKKLGDKLSEDRDLMPHMSDSTRKQLKKLGDKLSEATNKGVHVAKDVAERVRHFAVEATELTKLKIEIHKLKSDHDKLLMRMGERLWNLNKSKKLSDVQSIFAKDFKKMDEYTANIAKKGKEVSKISL